MNEQANTRLVQQAYQRIAQGNLPALVNMLAAAVQWELPDMANVPFAGTWQGQEGVGQFFRIVDQVQETVKFEPQEFIAQGDKVVVLGHFVMRIKTTGSTVSSAWAYVWTVQAGKITQFYEYVDTAAVSSAHTTTQRARSSAGS